MAGGEFNHRDYTTYVRLSPGDQQTVDAQVKRIDAKIGSQRTRDEDRRIVHDLPRGTSAAVVECLRDIYGGPGGFEATILKEDGQTTLLLD